MAKKSIYFDKNMEALPFVVASWEELLPSVDVLWDRPLKSQNNYFILCTQGWIKFLVDSEIYVQDSSTLVIITSGRSVQLLEVSPDYDGLHAACSAQFVHQIRNFDLYLFERISSVVAWQLLVEEYDSILQIFRLGLVYSKRTKHTSLQYIQRIIPLTLLMELQNVSRTLDASTKQILGRKQIHYTRFLELVRAHLYERQPVRFYLEQLQISERYLTQICREIGDNSIRGVIDLMVIREVRMVLVTTSHSIQEVAEMFQYPNVSYFIRFFRRMHGITPAQFRKDWLTIPMDDIRLTKTRRVSKSKGGKVK